MKVARGGRALGVKGIIGILGVVGVYGWYGLEVVGILEGNGIKGQWKSRGV